MRQGTTAVATLERDVKLGVYRCKPLTSTRACPKETAHATNVKNISVPDSSSTKSRPYSSKEFEWGTKALKSCDAAYGVCDVDRDVKDRERKRDRQRETHTERKSTAP